MIPVIILIIFVVIFFLVIWVVGKQLPTDWQLEKGAFIQASPEEIFAHLEDLSLWEEWSIWNKDPNGFDLQYKGNVAGIGASVIWKNNRLQGQLTITHSQTPNELQYHLDLNQGKFILSGIIVLSVTDAELTQMAWRCTARPPKQFQFLLRYQLFFLKNFFDRAMEESLSGMQQLFTTEDEGQQ